MNEKEKPNEKHGRSWQILAPTILSIVSIGLVVAFSFTIIGVQNNISYLQSTINNEQSIINNDQKTIENLQAANQAAINAAVGPRLVASTLILNQSSLQRVWMNGVAQQMYVANVTGYLTLYVSDPGISTSSGIYFGNSLNGNFTQGVDCNVFDSTTTACTLAGDSTVEVAVEGYYIALVRLSSAYHYSVYAVP